MTRTSSLVDGHFLSWIRDNVLGDYNSALFVDVTAPQYAEAIAKQISGVKTCVRDNRFKELGSSEQFHRIVDTECPLSWVEDFSPGGFDLVVVQANDGVHLQFEKLLAACRRTLNREGVLLVNAPNARYHARIDQLINGKYDSPDACATLASFSNIAAKVGLEIVSAFPHAGAGYAEWSAAGRSLNLQFSKFNFRAASACDAEEFFSESYSLLLQMKLPAAASTEARSSTNGEAESHSQTLQLARRNTVSVCLIVRDNEPTIVDCLQSIRPWVDEIVVVDTGSIDNTRDICETLGARVFDFAWCDDFSAARNESFRHAKCDWILWMDSDDVMPSSQGELLQRLVQTDHNAKCWGYVMQVRCPSIDNSNLTVVDHVKLVRNRPEVKFEHRIHEQVLPSIRRAGGEVAFTDIFLVHLGSRQTDAQHAKKLDRDFRLLAMENAERPDHPFVLFNLGMTCENAQRYHEAIAYLRKCIHFSEPGESQLRKAWALLTSSLQAIGDTEKAIATAKQGLRSFPNDAELLFRLGMLMQVQRRYSEAVAFYEKILQLPKENVFKSVDPAIFGAKTHHNLAGALGALGCTDAAIAHFEQAIEQMPSLSPAWYGLIDLLKSKGDSDRLFVLAQSPLLERQDVAAIRSSLNQILRS